MKEAPTRRVDVFFYGLFMDDALLREKGARPTNRRLAFVEDYRLRIGTRATLIPERGARVYGIVFSLTHEEVDTLYAETSVSAYRPEAIAARLADGSSLPALCFNLPQVPGANERNPQYAVKLRQLAEKIGLPETYVGTIK